MKRLFTLAILILLSLAAYAQSAEPFKKANTIEITTALPADSAFILWGTHLAQNGYTIDKSNPDFGMVSTGPKDTSKLNFEYVVNSVVSKDGKITVKLKWHLKSPGSEFNDWEYAPGYHVRGIVYQDFIKTVNTFPHKGVTYTVK